MPDYDVAAVSLASPPQSAPVTSYRPAVAVKNLGIHNADVTGTLRIYDRDAGTLLETKTVAASAITPGETRNATASTLWEPTEDDIGRAFLFIATIDYPPDQYLPNNNLAPVTVIVTAAEPPPPPPVEAHASQHEDGGGDEIDVEGLTGKLAEAQTPTEHASSHESGGADELTVDALAGVLAEPQTPKTHAVSHQTGGSDPVTGITPGDHATSHENGGSDELSVSGLSGLLADAQTPKIHASTHTLGGADETTHALQSQEYEEGTPNIDIATGTQDTIVAKTMDMADEPDAIIALAQANFYSLAPVTNFGDILMILYVDAVEKARGIMRFDPSPTLALGATLTIFAQCTVTGETPVVHVILDNQSDQTIRVESCRLLLLSAT